MLGFPKLDLKRKSGIRIMMFQLAGLHNLEDRPLRATKMVRCCPSYLEDPNMGFEYECETLVLVV